jgi:hypothetical protein
MMGLGELRCNDELTATATATNDYLLGAACGPAGGYGLDSNALRDSPQPLAGSADSTQLVVISCS